MKQAILCKRPILRALSTRLQSCSASFTEENARVVEHFGGTKREADGRLYTCEELTRSWKSMMSLKESVGNRAYAFQGAMSVLEHALLSYALSTARKLKPNFEFLTVDDVLPISTTTGCGFPVPESTERSMQYLLLDDKHLCLSGTAEMGIADKLKNKILDDLPRWFIAKSRCFRPEISQAMSEAKLYRVHEFFKVEMFVACHPHQSSDILKEVIAIQKEVFTGLDLHCRLLDMPAKELGASAAQKFDIEAWMPGRKLFGEVSSASNCTDYQSQRLQIKFRDDDGQEQFVHTCNGTVLASTRALIALLEMHQNGGGAKTCAFPESLKPWLPKERSPVVYLEKAPSFIYRFYD